MPGNPLPPPAPACHWLVPSCMQQASYTVPNGLDLPCTPTCAWRYLACHRLRGRPAPPAPSLPATPTPFPLHTPTPPLLHHATLLLLLCCTPTTPPFTPPHIPKRAHMMPTASPTPMGGQDHRPPVGGPSFLHDHYADCWTVALPQVLPHLEGRCLTAVCHMPVICPGTNLSDALLGGTHTAAGRLSGWEAARTRLLPGRGGAHALSRPLTRHTSHAFWRATDAPRRLRV